MVLDQKLLEQAKDAGTRLADAERDALLARANYHTAIRRLHLGGASLREMAQALSLSHQRIQQIVTAAGGSWWQVWRRRGTIDAVCTWCGRPPSEVANLIAGPKIYVCDACVESAERVFNGHGDLKRVSRSAHDRCGFCRKRANHARPIVTGPRGICRECLRVCREILESRAV